MKKIFVFIVMSFLFVSCQEDFERIVQCGYSVRIENDTTYSIDVSIGENTFKAIAANETTEYKTTYYEYDEKINKYGYIKKQSIYINETGLIKINRGNLTFVCNNNYKYTIKITYDFYSGSYIYYVSEVN